METFNTNTKHLRTNLSAFEQSAPQSLWIVAWITGVPFLVAFVVIAIMALGEHAPASSAKASSNPQFTVQSAQPNVNQGQ